MIVVQVEVIVEPVLPFELALCGARDITLSPVGSWCIDSYDSRDETPTWNLVDLFQRTTTWSTALSGCRQR